MHLSYKTQLSDLSTTDYHSSNDFIQLGTNSMSDSMSAQTLEPSIVQALKAEGPCPNNFDNSPETLKWIRPSFITNVNMERINAMHASIVNFKQSLKYNKVSNVYY